MRANGVVTSSIRYLALLSNQPFKLAEFYRSEFGLSLVSKSDEDDVTLTDGRLQLTIFRSRDILGEPRQGVGFHHLGIEGCDIEGIKARHRIISPRMVIVAEHGGDHRGDLRIYDPEANAVSLRESVRVRTGHAGQQARVCGIVLRSLNPQRQLAYYRSVFGLRDFVPGSSLTDGQVRLEFKAFYESGRPTGRFNISEIEVGVTGSTASNAIEHVNATVDPDSNKIRVAAQATAAQI